MTGMTGMMFGGEGPIMQGTWYDPQSGDAFTVRDSFFEDNQYVVTTTDGRYLNYDQLQRYVQSDMKLEDLKKMKADKKQTEEPLPTEISSILEGPEDNNSYGILPEDLDIINGNKLGNLYAAPKSTLLTSPFTPVNNSQTTTELNAAAKSTVNMNTAIIDKALKNATAPKIVLDIDWNDYPSKQIEMLKDIMDISLEEIVEWYLNNIQMSDFVATFQESIKNYILNGGKKVVRIDEDVKKTEKPVKTQPKTDVKKTEKPVKTQPKTDVKKTAKK